MDVVLKLRDGEVEMDFILIMVSTIGIKLSQLGVNLLQLGLILPQLVVSRIRNCSASIQNLKLTTNTQLLR